MRLTAFRTAMLACSLLTAIAVAPLEAQQASAPSAASSGKPDHVSVRVAGSSNELRGRLLRLDAKTLTLQVDVQAGDAMPSRKVVDIAVERVLRIDREDHDSLINGAIFGALYVAACVKWWCGQGMSSEPELPRDLWIGAALGAGVGAAVDSVFFKRTTIYQAPKGPSPSKPFALGFVLRF